MIVLIRLLLKEIKEFQKLSPWKPNLCHIRGSLMSTTSILDNGFAKKMFVSIGYLIFLIDYTKTMNDIINLVCMLITFCNIILINFCVHVYNSNHNCYLGPLKFNRLVYVFLFNKLRKQSLFCQWYSTIISYEKCLVTDCLLLSIKRCYC